jgi:hypothetical protein
MKFCECGCGLEAKNRFVQGHNKHPSSCNCLFCRATLGEMKGNLHPLYGRHHTDSTKKLISETRTRLIKEGKIIQWNKGKKGLSVAWNKGKKGVMPIPWNSGLHGEDYRKHFKDGKMWNEGKTKDNNPSLKIVSLKATGRPRPDMKTKNFMLKNIGKTFEEIYGEERARSIKEKMSHHTGKDHCNWKGGGFCYYGSNWVSKSKKMLKKYNLSEISHEKTKPLNVHHIHPLKMIIGKFLDVCYDDCVEEKITVESFRVLPFDLIPNEIFEEANRDDNLIVVTVPEHHKVEGMPPTFFDAVRRCNECL